MELWLAFAALCAGLAAFFAARPRTGRSYRPLASRQPARATEEAPELGTEALDLAEVARIQRRNEALERGHTNWTRGRSVLGSAAADTYIAPWADDETYAKRYRTAYQKRED
ncbi:MAG: hypothetical protein AAF744_13195 [Pseudomonadota bacterium]